MVIGGRRLDPRGLRAQAAGQGRARRRRHHARSPRPPHADARPAPAVRDPPGRPRRPAHRPEADPRRLEAARVHGHLPLRKNATPSSAPTPSGPRSARSCSWARRRSSATCSPTRASRSTSAGARTSAPAGSTAACSPRSSSSPPPASSRPSPRSRAATATTRRRATSPHHSTGSAVDIAAVNGIPITPATQGKGSITDVTIQRLLTLQGTMKPRPDHLPDDLRRHGQHVRHGRPRRPHPRRLPARSTATNAKAARRIAAVLKPEQWIKLIDRLGAIANPEVREQPSRFSVKVVKRASRAHRAE